MNEKQKYVAVACEIAITQLKSQSIKQTAERVLQLKRKKGNFARNRNTNTKTYIPGIM